MKRSIIMVHYSSVSPTVKIAFQRMEIFLRKNFKAFLSDLEKSIEGKSSTSLLEIMENKKDVPIIMQLSSGLTVVTLADFASAWGKSVSQDVIDILYRRPIQTVIDFGSHGKEGVL